MVTKSVAANKLAPYGDRYKCNIHLSLSTLLFRIKKWRRNTITRQALAGLDPSYYKDIGMTAEQVAREIHKKFWQ